MNAPASDIPPSIRGPFWNELDRLFLSILAASLFIHFSVVTWIALTPRPPERELGLDEMVDRFAKLSPTLALPARAEGSKDVKAGADEKKPDAQKRKAEAPSGFSSAAKTRELVQKSGLLKILTSKGSSGGALADVLGDSTGTADIGEALAGARGVGVATAESVTAAGQKGGGTGKVAGIGQLGTAGGGKVQLAKADTQVHGTVKESAPMLEGSSVNPAQLSRFVGQRKSAIQACYEKELKRNPTLKGRIVVRFVISPQGRATDIEIEENTMGSEAVASCIRNVVRVWTFPFKPDDGAAVAYPFVFSPAS